MTNEEFWAKPANAVYTTPVMTKTGMIIMLLIIGCIIKGIAQKITTRDKNNVRVCEYQNGR